MNKSVIDFSMWYSVFDVFCKNAINYRLLHTNVLYFTEIKTTQKMEYMLHVDNVQLFFYHG